MQSRGGDYHPTWVTIQFAQHEVNLLAMNVANKALPIIVLELSNCSPENEMRVLVPRK